MKMITISNILVFVLLLTEFGRFVAEKVVICYLHAFLPLSSVVGMKKYWFG